jgi:hypothetical protein
MRESVNLGFYGLLAGPKLRERAIQPLRDHLYRFGAMQVDKGHRIFVYTCRGNFRATTVESTTTPALIFHWRRTANIFSPQVSVALMRIDALTIEKSPPRRPSQNRIILLDVA